MTSEEKAKELAKMVAEQINLEREGLAERMLEAGMIPDKYTIQDNLLEVIKNPAVPYQCWSELIVKGFNN